MTWRSSFHGAHFGADAACKSRATTSNKSRPISRCKFATKQFRLNTSVISTGHSRNIRNSNSARTRALLISTTVLSPATSTFSTGIPSGSTGNAARTRYRASQRLLSELQPPRSAQADAERVRGSSISEASSPRESEIGRAAGLSFRMSSYCLSLCFGDKPQRLILHRQILAMKPRNAPSLYPSH
jgi:hypothetical protein